MSMDTTRQRILVDGGTTTTRVWAVDGATVLAEARATIGARDSAREGSNARWVQQLGDLIAQAEQQARNKVAQWRPACVAAAGMITSPLGLAEAPHVVAPADIHALAAGVRQLSMPELTPLPILLVPGVRCGPLVPAQDDIDAVDVMRGEEVVCLGLVHSGQLPNGGAMLSVGSHWKLVEVEAQSIRSSTTTLSGELLHALRTQTVLASSIDRELPDVLTENDLEAMRLGMRQRGISGFSRAAFCTRLMERVPGSAARERLLFLLGVVIAETMAYWQGFLQQRTIALLGAPALCQAWEVALADAGGNGITVVPAEVTLAYATGLGAVVEALSLTPKM